MGTKGKQFLGTAQSADGSGRDSSELSGEQVLEARPVSRGIARGIAVSLHGQKRHFYRIQLDQSQISDEVRRFHTAVRSAKRELEKILKSPKYSENTPSVRGVFEIQHLFLTDQLFLSKIEDLIVDGKINAEWAIKTVADEYIHQFRKIEDEHLRSKYLDIEDVAERLVLALRGDNSSSFRLPKNSVIVAKELNPSALIELAQCKPAAVITERGGWTSHTFIVAREMNLPAVTGVKHVLRKISTGDMVAVDGNRGMIIINPDRDLAVGVETPNPKSKGAKNKRAELRTLDGMRITVRANLDTPEAYPRAQKFGAEGVGLFRSEFLFNQFKSYPPADLQEDTYSRIIELAGGHGVTIRTFDLNLTDLPAYSFENEKNPALGKRAIRLSLSQKKEFRTQLRALLLASAKGDVRVCFPMISDVSEIRAAKALLAEERRKLGKQGLKTGNTLIGAMIEVPAAVLTVDDIAAEVDFLCLGTNDLVQYLLAADRDNESMADMFRSLHPAVIRAIKCTIDAAAKAAIPLTICGEMAGSPFYVPVLLGLGATIFSMNVNSIPRVRKTIEGIAYEEAREVVNKAMKCKLPDEIEKMMKNYIRSHWSHVAELESLSK